MAESVLPRDWIMMSTVADSSTTIDLSHSHGLVDWTMSHSVGILVGTALTAYMMVAIFNREHRDLYIALFNSLIAVPALALAHFAIAAFSNLIAIPIVEHRWVAAIPVAAPIVAFFLIPRRGGRHRESNDAMIVAPVFA